MELLINRLKKTSNNSPFNDIAGWLDGFNHANAVCRNDVNCCAFGDEFLGDNIFLGRQIGTSTGTQFASVVPSRPSRSSL